MTDFQPNQPPASASASGGWHRMDFFVVGIWLSVPLGVFGGRQLLLPIFEDFGTALSPLSQFVFHFYALVFLTVASLFVVLTLLCTPGGRARRPFRWLAGVSGVLLGLVCFLAFAMPLVALLQNLS